MNITKIQAHHLSSRRTGLLLAALLATLTTGCHADVAEAPGSGGDGGSSMDGGHGGDGGSGAAGGMADGGGGMGGGCATPCDGATPLCDEASGTCVACFADADCNDADSCTNDACSAGACVYSYAEGASCEPSWGLQNPASASPSVGWAAAAYDPIADRVIVFGGNSASGAQDATWSWDGTNWTQLFPATSPSARYSHGMAYDPMLGRIVLFGGLSAPGMSNALADTWEWDGTTWTEVTPAVSPSARSVHRNMAYNPSSGRVMIFGGGTGPSQPIFDDVWEYDGTTWQQISPAVTPSARVASCMVTDSGQSRVLMFGGGQWQNPFENDTWSYANNAFVQLSPANSPPPLQSANCAYDEWRGRVVLQGGSTSQVPLTFTNATWELDGNTWNDVTPSNGPGQTCCSIMATNPGGRGVMLLTTDGETWTFEPPAVP